MGGMDCHWPTFVHWDTSACIQLINVVEADRTVHFIFVISGITIGAITIRPIVIAVAVVMVMAVAAVVVVAVAIVLMVTTVAATVRF